jgi:hypothetical protein
MATEMHGKEIAPLNAIIQEQDKPEFSGVSL